MRTVHVLIIVYVIIIVAVFIFLQKFRTRGLSRRILSDITPCPFGKRAFFEYSREGGRSDREGIVSFSLYGVYKKYAPSLLRQLDDIPKYLKSWQAVVYTPIDIPDQLRYEIISRGAELVIMNGGSNESEARNPSGPKIGVLGHEGALWRFLPSMGILPFVTLDADDEFDPKLPERIHRWLREGSQFFIFSPINVWIPMMAGRWGGRGIEKKDKDGKPVDYWIDPGHSDSVSHKLHPPVPDMLERINRYCDNWFGFDEAFLKREIWPIVRKDYSQTTHWPMSSLLVLGIILAFVAAMIALVASRDKDNALAACLARK